MTRAEQDTACTTSTHLARILLDLRVGQLVATQLALREELRVALARVRLALVALHVGLQRLLRLVVVLADVASVRLARTVNLQQKLMHYTHDGRESQTINPLRLSRAKHRPA